MKLPEDTSIAPEKLSQYLLVFKKRNDKSQWLNKAGYSSENWQMLRNDLRKQILPIEAQLIEETKFGQLYKIRGKLTGPNGIPLSVCAIWIIEAETGMSKFVTMYPNKKESTNDI